MILEVAILRIKPELMEQFEADFPKAEAIVSSIPGYISHEMQRCVETKAKYHFLIRWENIDAHLVNFRQSPKFQDFRAIVGPYFAEPPVAEHFEAISKHRL